VNGWDKIFWATSYWSDLEMVKFSARNSHGRGPSQKKILDLQREIEAEPTNLA